MLRGLGVSFTLVSKLAVLVPSASALPGNWADRQPVLHQPVSYPSPSHTETTLVAHSPQMAPHECCPQNAHTVCSLSGSEAGLALLATAVEVALCDF